MAAIPRPLGRGLSVGEERRQNCECQAEKGPSVEAGLSMRRRYAVNVQREVVVST